MSTFKRIEANRADAHLSTDPNETRRALKKLRKLQRDRFAEHLAQQLLKSGQSKANSRDDQTKANLSICCLLPVAKRSARTTHKANPIRPVAVANTESPARNSLNSKQPSKARWQR